MISIRPAQPEDVGIILQLIRELAAFEREPDAVEMTEEGLARAMFGERPAASVDLAVIDGSIVGIALWFVTFSTWVGKPGIYLEELYVSPQARRRGVGRALLAHLAGICRDRDYGRLELSVLDWNESALTFYRSLGMRPMSDWTVQRLTGPPLAELAGG